MALRVGVWSTSDSTVRPFQAIHPAKGGRLEALQRERIRARRGRVIGEGLLCLATVVRDSVRDGGLIWDAIEGHGRFELVKPLIVGTRAGRESTMGV